MRLRGKEQKEILDRRDFGIYGETDRLRKAVTWGPAGIAAGLTRFLPESISLFLESMDVMEARRQYEEFERTLVQNGVEVIRMRDEMADVLGKSREIPISKDITDFKNAVIKKASEYSKTFHLGGGFGYLIAIVDEVLNSDLEKYGDERVVLLLNEKLTNVYEDKLPLANAIFARDQQNVIGNTVVFSRMKHLIRRPEVDLFMRYGDRAFGDQKNLVIEGGNAYFEGGDPIVFDGNCYVGVGGRTNLDGVVQLAGLAENQGLKVYAVVHPDRSSGRRESQSVMHLDTFFMRGPKNTVVVFEQEARERQVIQIHDELFGIEQNRIGSFWDVLVRDRYDIITITHEEQLAYGANFLALDDETVLLTMACNGTAHMRLAKEFTDRGIRVIIQDMTAITQGYGGAHCSITPIWRAN